MKQKEKLNLWVQVFLSYKYLNEFLKEGLLKVHGLTPYDYFLLTNLRIYEDLTFYEINKYMPIDGKSIHKKINDFIERGLMEREFHDNGSSAINLTEKARKIIHVIHNENMDASSEYFEAAEIENLSDSLYEFNEKMREVLELSISEETLNKINKELY